MAAMRRTLTTVAATLVWLVAFAAPVSAHSVSGVSATNFETRITAVEPRFDGVTIEVVEAGSRLELTNDTSAELVVFGYQDEPYLRVSRAGVYENRRSPAVYLNASRDAGAAVPGTADPEADPQWVKVSDGNVARWHDHRAHWMGDQDPPAVRRAPGERHVIDPSWEVPMDYAGESLVVTGTLTWVPGPSAAPWWSLAAGAFVVTAALVLVAARSRWGLAVLVLLAALVAVDVVHAFGIAFGAAGTFTTQLGKLFGASFASFIAWGVAVAGMPLLARDNDDGLWFAGFSALFITLVGGVNDIGDLTKSQVPFAWSAGLARALVALTLGLGVGLVVSTVVLLVRGRGEPVEEVVPSASHA
jgi:hypothetical protein